MNLLKSIKTIFKGIVFSYPQVFLSQSKIFAGLLILISFIDPYTGIGGLTCLLTANLAAYFIGLNEHKIANGLYGFNALLVGLGIASYFTPSIELYVVIIFSGLLTLFITVACEGVIGKYSLPFLSLPFLFSIWIIQLASGEFSSIGISERGIYFLNELYNLGGKPLVDLYNEWNQNLFPDSLKSYFLSLGAIFFQDNILAGILISIGILFYSRIAFTLSLIGFYAAYFFYILIGSDITQITYSYVGFNYILTAIAIGGFFIIPSKGSYLWVVLLIPLTSLITIGCSHFLSSWHLSVYSLPFNVIVLMFIYTLRFRNRNIGQLSEVYVQQFMPERNLYNYYISVNRFSKSFSTFPIKLPFWGNWSIEQGHKGEQTHKDDWQYAWDFTIHNNDNKTYHAEGTSIEDYFCYNKAIIAPGNGIIEEIINDIPDNAVGEINLQHNWGNTIIIKHAEYLYSSLSHLKPGSIKVVKGEFVKAGQVIASVGNSGRSPEPHLHFQLQATPYLGSKTLFYPINHYLTNTKTQLQFHSFDIPAQGNLVSNIEINSLIKKAFTFIPGQKISIIYEENNIQKQFTWEVITDIYNNTYIHCPTTNSTVYLFNDGIIHFFKHFDGDRNSALYHFYLGCYKISLGFYKNLTLADQFSLSQVFSLPVLVPQDFVAPFFRFMSADYKVTYTHIDDLMNPTHIILESETHTKIGKHILSSSEYTITIDPSGIKTFRIKAKRKSATLSFIHK